jgi:hypothetical protein
LNIGGLEFDNGGDFHARWHRQLRIRISQFENLEHLDDKI